MKTSIRLLSGLASAIFIMAGSIAQAENLPEAVDFMLKSHPDIRSQSYNRMAKEKEVRQAKAGYLPTIDVSAGTGVSRQHQPFFDTTPTSTAVLSVRQNLFRGFGTQSEVERQEARVASQATLLHGTSENNALQVTKAYLNVLRNQELYDLAKENLTNHQRIFDQVKLRSESGVDRKADFDQVMGRVALAQSNLIAAQANMVDSTTDYQAVVGHLPGSLAPAPSAASSMPATMESAEQLALKNNPIIASAKADLDARNAQYATAKSQNYPSFDLALDYKWNRNVDNPGQHEAFVAMALVSFNIFNGGWNKARIGQTTLEVSEAEEILANSRRQTAQSVRLSWEANKAINERIAFLSDYVKSSGQTADAFAAQWNIGRRTMFDLLDTQAEHINAKASLVNANYDKLYSEYRVLNSMAKLLPFLGLQPPAQSRIVPQN